MNQTLCENLGLATLAAAKTSIMPLFTEPCPENCIAEKQWWSVQKAKVFHENGGYSLASLL